ncbi:uncharacterized protein LOC123211064 isoform X3 [Mangifera indica]|uniref:uncharacterized protein LOC123211064 isoform X3 n=1 Tax=Mangifera indica TaxID=29780 RepID=UPI001CF9CCA7|nr:uncharacterized protein LOC123211064 isoform X3 [Mangifera indica]
MENSETSNGDDSSTSTVPPPMNENVESDSSHSEQGDSDSEEVTGEAAVNVNNPMQQPLSRGHQDYRVYTTGRQFPANQNTVLQYHNFPQRMPLQLATAGQQVPANQNYGVQGYISPQGIPFPLAGQARVVARGRRTAQALINPTGPSQWRYPALVSPLFRNSFIPFDLMRGDFHQPQATAPIQPPIRFTSPPSTFGSVLAAGRRSRLGLASDAPFRPSSSRSANQSLPIGSSRTPQSQTDFSGLHDLAQAAENFPTDHIKQGSVLAAGRRSRLGLVSDAPFRPSSSRSANQSLPIGSSRTRQSRTDFSGLHALAQAAENFPTDHIKQAGRRSRLGLASYAPFRPSSSRSANQSLPVGSSRTPQSRTDFSGPHGLAKAAENFPTDHIKQDFDKPPEPSGRKCFLCKRDLSFTPATDGPVSQPRLPPSVAVLPCGHYFHACCLEIVTPPEKSTDPPCIVCDLDENAS